MRHTRLAPALVLPLGVLACSDPAAPRRSETKTSHDAAPEVFGNAPENEDQIFAAAAKAIPGFGGFFFDDDGVPTVYLKDPGTASSVDGQLRTMFLSGPMGSAQESTRNRDPIRYRVGKYTFTELAQFRATVGRLGGKEKLIAWLDIDEAHNRVTVAARDASAQSRLTDAVRGAGVPGDAFLVMVAAPDQPVVNDSLTGLFTNPLPGGARIFDTSFCTLGFNINWGGRSGFVTASHCSDYFAGLTPTTPMGHPFGGQPWEVAVEVADPRQWQNTSDCLFSRVFEGVDVCRYSDAAVYQANDTTPNSRFAVGYIARTQGVGNRLIDLSNPHWEIISKKNPTYVGEWMERNGQVTFWQHQQVTNTCTTHYITMPDGQYAKLWCQHILSGQAIPGDSGGPVFFRIWCGLSQYRPDGTECVALAGTTYAANSTQTKFSPISGIETDFGTLRVTVADQP